MKINHFSSKVISGASQRLKTDGPGKCQDDKPQGSHQWKVVHKNKGKNAQETVILAGKKLKKKKVLFVEEILKLYFDVFNC